MSVTDWAHWQCRRARWTPTSARRAAAIRAIDALDFSFPILERRIDAAAGAAAMARRLG
jgi:hypothetical protein